MILRITEATESSSRWLRPLLLEHMLQVQEMISSSFNKFNIGRAAWSYRSMNFGLSDERLSGVLDKLIKLL